MSPKIIYSSKHSLSQAEQGCVDSLLKDFKTCTRRLHAAIQSQQIDLQVLERLYYKSKNQHRSALFLRRIEEIRRYASRLVTQQVESAVNQLRLSFWGPTHEQTSKTTKGVWTHVPDSHYVKHVLDRLSLVHRLIAKMHGCLERTYHHLHLNFQTGAFLQLILTLTAITSRLAILSDELRSSIEFTWELCYRLLHLLDPTQVTRSRHLVLAGDWKCSGEPSMRSRDGSKLPLRVVAHAFEDDVGSSVQRITSNIKPVESAPSHEPHASERPATEEEVIRVDTSIVFSLSQESNQVSVEGKTATVVRKTVNRAATQASGTSSMVSSNHKRSQLPESNSKKSERKIKKRRDEIDDIFGF